MTGDQDGDDGLDNEIITVDLNRVNDNVNSIVFFLNIYNNNEYSGDFRVSHTHLFVCLKERLIKLPNKYLLNMTLQPKLIASA